VKSIVGSLLNRTPIPYGGSRSSIFKATSDRPPQEKYLGAMGAQSTIFAIVDRIATSIAAVEWRLYRKASKPEDREETKTHPALVVLNKPNAHYTRTEFFETLQQHFELTGEMWMLLSRSNLLNGSGPPIELWPVRPDRMRPVPSPSEFIAGYTYKNGRDEIPLRISDVIYNKRPSPLDPYRGIGPIGTLLIDIEGEHAASAYNTQFFHNGAEPGGILEIPEILSDDEFDKLVAHWEQQHRGVNNAHKVAVVEAGVWKERTYTMRDMQFEQLRRFSRETFRQAWGFPKPMLGDVEDVNRANAEAASFVFADQLLIPRLRRWRTMLNDDYLPQFGSMGAGYEFDFDPVIPRSVQDEREDTRMAAQAAQMLVSQNFDPAETLAAFGLPPISHPMSDGDSSDPRAVAELIQKIYLGVGVVLSSDEARAIANKAGAGLVGPLTGNGVEPASSSDKLTADAT
jgi:HK97 family phage portal protein